MAGELPIITLGQNQLTSDLTAGYHDVAIGYVGNVYRKPYPDWMGTVPYLKGFKMPEFSLFTIEDDHSTFEHITRFLALCGDVVHGDHWKLRLFPLSMSKMTFTWFIALSPNLVLSWEQMERLFHSSNGLFQICRLWTYRP